MVAAVRIAERSFRSSNLPSATAFDIMSLGLVWRCWCQVVLSVPAVTARRVDRLELLEIELVDSVELVRQSESVEVVRQVVEPGAVSDCAAMVLQFGRASRDLTV